MELALVLVERWQAMEQQFHNASNDLIAVERMLSVLGFIETFSQLKHSWINSKSVDPIQLQRVKAQKADLEGFV